MGLQAQGRVRQIGVSNYKTEHIQELVVRNLTLPAVNQIEWHLGWHDDQMLAYLEAHGIVMQAYSPLGGAGSQHPSVPLSSLEQIAATHGVSTAQVALRWSLQQGVCPVTATLNVEHMKGDLGIFRFNLTQPEMTNLAQLKPSKPLIPRPLNPLRASPQEFLYQDHH